MKNEEFYSKTQFLLFFNKQEACKDYFLSKDLLQKWHNNMHRLRKKIVIWFSLDDLFSKWRQGEFG